MYIWFNIEHLFENEKSLKEFFFFSKIEFRRSKHKA